MIIYLAIDDETGEVKAFTDFEAFKKFSIRERYAYEYIKVSAEEVEVVPDVELFYYENPVGNE